MYHSVSCFIGLTSSGDLIQESEGERERGRVNSKSTSGRHKKNKKDELNSDSFTPFIYPCQVPIFRSRCMSRGPFDTNNPWWPGAAHFFSHRYSEACYIPVFSFLRSRCSVLAFYGALLACHLAVLVLAMNGPHVCACKCFCAVCSTA